MAASYAVAHNGDRLTPELHGHVVRLDASINIYVGRSATAVDDQLNGGFEGADYVDLIRDKGGSEDGLGLARAHGIGGVRPMVENDQLGVDVRGGNGVLVSFEGFDERNVEQSPSIVLETFGPSVISARKFVWQRLRDVVLVVTLSVVVPRIKFDQVDVGPGLTGGEREHLVPPRHEQIVGLENPRLGDPVRVVIGERPGGDQGSISLAGT